MGEALGNGGTAATTVDFNKIELQNGLWPDSTRGMQWETASWKNLNVCDSGTFPDWDDGNIRSAVV